MGEGAATVSGEGVILFANPQLASFLGVERDSMIGRDLADYVAEDQQSALVTLLGPRPPRPRRAELRWPGPTAARVPFHVAATDIDLDGVLVHCLVFTDLTVQKLFERQLAEEVTAARAAADRGARSTTPSSRAWWRPRWPSTSDRSTTPAAGRQHVEPRTATGSASSPEAGRLEPGMAVRRTPARRRESHDRQPQRAHRRRLRGPARPDQHGHRAPPGAGGSVVATAAEGEEAIEEARSSQPDLVLLDIAMPVMDGMQALPHIREAAPDAVVVMLSGYPISTASQGALNAGAHGYLEKSDLVKGLIPRLERIIESQPPV